MKRLNAFMDTMQQQQQLRQQMHQHPPLNLTFYLRKRVADGYDPNIVKVQVQLRGRDAKTDLTQLLK